MNAQIHDNHVLLVIGSMALVWTTAILVLAGIADYRTKKVVDTILEHLIRTERENSGD